MSIQYAVTVATRRYEQRLRAQTADETRNALYKWVVDGWESVGEAPHPDPVLRTLWAFERAQRAATSQEVAALVRDYGLPMEAVPTDKRSREVWEALLPHAGLTFLIRNLGNLSKAGILRKGAHAEIKLVADRLTEGRAKLIQNQRPKANLSR